MSSPPASWGLLDAARREGLSLSAIESVVAPAALLLALRWADEHDAEQTAIALFNGEEGRTLLPPEIRWPVWREAPRSLTSTEVTALWSRIREVLGLPVDPRNTHHEVRLPSGRLLSALVAWIEQLPFDTPAARRQAGESFTELVLHAMESAQFGGEFVTPRAIGRLMVALADPRPGERIYDPCFGTGGLLVDAADALWSHAHDMSPAEWLRALRMPVFGIEKSGDLHLVAFVRLLLTGVRPALEMGDALEREAAGRHHDQGFDCVLLDPPFGGKVVREHLYDFQIHTRTSENLFVQHAVRSLRPGGRAVIAVAPGLLFRGGADYELRRWLLTEYHIDAVLRLPARSRLPYTSVRPSLLVIRRAPPSRTVQFIELLTIPETDEACRRLSASLLDRASLAPHTAVDVEIEELLRTDARLDISSTAEVAPDEALADLAAKVELRPLGEVAELTAGIPVRREAVMEHAEPGAVPIVRVGDLIDGALRLGERFLRAEARADVRSDQFVRHGDVLLSVDGTIGKVLFVRDSAPAGRIGPLAVAQKGLVIVRPHEILDGQFLQATLASEAFQGLLKGLAHGETIAHLPLNTLRKVRVPVPSPAVQTRLLQKLEDQPGDAVEALMAVLAGREENPLARLFREHVSIMRLLGDGMPEPQEFYQLGLDGLMALAALRNQAALDTVDVSDHATLWLKTVGSVPAASVVHHTRVVDYDTPDKTKTIVAYDTLEATGTMLEHAGSAARLIGGWLGRQAVRLTDRLLLWVAAARTAAAGNFDLEIDFVSEEMVQPEVVQARMSVGLSGTASLKDFVGHINVCEMTWLDQAALSANGLQDRIPPETAHLSVNVLQDRIQPETIHFDQLSPGDKVQLTFLVDVKGLWQSNDGGLFVDVLLDWFVTWLDGERVNSKHFFRLTSPSIVSGRAVDGVEVDLGASPYITAGVVDSPEMFFGRRSILDDIRTHLGGGTKVILLEGNRRTGKTSILRQLKLPEIGLVDSWILVECSFQGAAGHATKAGIETENVFRLMVKDIFEACAKAKCPVPLPDTPMASSPRQIVKDLTAYFRDVDPYEALQIYVDQVVQALAPKRLLLMLDEFDKLQEGIDNGVTSPQVPDNIRHLLQTRPAVSAIITGLGRLKRLREEYWSALFGFGHSIGVKPLEPAEVRALVTRPVAGRLTFDDLSVSLIEELTARQPYLVQCLCARIFELAKSHGWRHIRQEEVRAAESRMVHDNEHFQALWKYANTERRRYLLCLCSRLADGPQRLNADLLNEHLREAGIVVPLEQVDDDLSFLVELELVAMGSTPLGPQYGLSVPLMKRWMDLSVDPEAQRRKAVYEQQHAGSAYFIDSERPGTDAVDGRGFGPGIEDEGTTGSDLGREEDGHHE